MSKSLSVEELTNALNTTKIMDNSENVALITPQNISLAGNKNGLESCENDLLTPPEKVSEATNSNQQERVSSTKHQDNEVGEEDDVDSQRLLLALSLYHKGAKLEEEGKVYDAINFYRKAMHIDPKIEFKYKSNNCPQSTHDCNEEALNLLSKPEDGICTKMDFYKNFQNYVYSNYNGRLMQSDSNANVICTQTMHISDLPSELIVHILSYVVSSHLDMRSLEQCAVVCKGLYICSRDEKLWRKACQKIWKNNVGTLSEKDPVPYEGLKDLWIPEDNGNEVESQNIYNSWREMFINRARVFFDGCYIGRTRYRRFCENSFQDQFYRPIQVVEYYRFLRFRADGTCYMLTTTENPRQSVTLLENVNVLRPDVIKGKYHLDKDTVHLVFTKIQHCLNLHSKTSSKSKSPTYGLTTYYMQFNIRNVKNRKFSKLTWLKYTMTHAMGKRETTSDFNVTSSRYPTLWFKRLRGYNAQSEGPLD